MAMPAEFQTLLRKQKYWISGSHSAVKLCHWTKQSILHNRACYKQRFYGIESHRCLQCTPAAAWCQQKCVFCWRPHEFSVPFPERWDEPNEIIDGLVEGQRKLLEGYYGIPDRADMEKLGEAQHPNQAAISLAGEPTMYPKISGLIEEFGRRKFTTFLVTNGMLPETLENMALPTQLYVSLDAPNEEAHKKTNVPFITDSWQRLNRTLELFPSLDTRKVIRITLVKGWNDSHPEQYARLIEKSEADFVEVKAYMFVGSSRQRMAIANMPSHDEVKSFSGLLNAELGYDFVDEQPESRVVLLGSGSKPQRI